MHFRDILIHIWRPAYDNYCTYSHFFGTLVGVCDMLIDTSHVHFTLIYDHDVDEEFLSTLQLFLGR